jgi:sigma-B regulation protein RsbU (phosphoserine phosphatase)
MTSPGTEAPERMTCMEVWGGNTTVNRAIETAGLDVWIYSCPYDQADRGGDVYYVSSCASGRITRLLLADVCGHGISVANIASDLRDLMRRNINFISQTRFVREMNQQFADHPRQDGFATALVCTFFASTQTLQFCNAGHPVPLLYRAAEGKWISADQLQPAEVAEGISNTPLGVIEEAGYSRFDTKLAQGDMMLCVSDAFTESEDGQGNLLGSSKMLDIVNELDSSRPGELIPQLMERIAACHEGNLAQDDATAMLFRANGSRPSLSDNLKAPFRLLGAVRDNTKVIE